MEHASWSLSSLLKVCNECFSGLKNGAGAKSSYTQREGYVLEGMEAYAEDL